MKCIKSEQDLCEQYCTVGVQITMLFTMLWLSRQAFHSVCPRSMIHPSRTRLMQQNKYPFFFFFLLPALSHGSKPSSSSFYLRLHEPFCLLHELYTVQYCVLFRMRFVVLHARAAGCVPSLSLCLSLRTKGRSNKRE